MSKMLYQRIVLAFILSPTFIIIRYKAAATANFSDLALKAVSKLAIRNDAGDIGEIDYPNENGSEKTDKIRGIRDKNDTEPRSGNITTRENPMDIKNNPYEFNNYTSSSNSESTTDEQNIQINSSFEAIKIDFMENPSQTEDSLKPTYTMQAPSARNPNKTDSLSRAPAGINLTNYHRLMIDYIVHLLCHDGSYEFIHVYVERSLATQLADALIMQLNHCMFAGVLTSR